MDKINIDVAVRVEQQIVGLGIVNFFFVEAETALWGIEVAESIGRNSAIMETDSQKVANL